jgi:hypothetical protein
LQLAGKRRVLCTTPPYNHGHITIFDASAPTSIADRGWDQTVSNGANLSFPEALGVNDQAGDSNASANQWIVGLINAG